MSNLFSLKSIKNKPHRDGFDLSFSNTMTAPLGALVPCMFKDVMPGDKFKINTSWFTRSQPCTAPAYSKFTEYVDFFFVPYHFLWRYFPDFIAQANNNNFADNVQTVNAPSFTQHPYFTELGFTNYLNRILGLVTIDQDAEVLSKRSGLDLFGLTNGSEVYRVYGIKRLFEYLGYGNIRLIKSNPPSTGETNYFKAQVGLHSETMNPFPLLAYNKIYNDFYRNSQWEEAIPRNFNVDYLTPFGSSMEMPISGMMPYPNNNDSFYLDTMFDLKYCNYNKDMFTGCLPNKQYGSSALASPLLAPNGNLAVASAQKVKYFESEGAFYVPALAVTDNNSARNLGISALAIRQAEFLQKWKEITQSGGTDYVSQMEKHFGVKPNSDIAHRCQYLGGITKNFGADEVVNTNLTGDNEANIMGKCVNTGNGSLSFSSNEHGIIMGIYHISLLPSYDASCDRLLFKTTPTDYVIPELDNIGMQPIYRNEVQMTKNSKIMGYVPRYSEYKSSVDIINGAFVDTYKNWVTPITSNFKGDVNSGALSYANFKVCPLTLNNLFNVLYDGSYETDQFFVNLAFDIKAVRNISRDGLPF